MTQDVKALIITVNFRQDKSTLEFLRSASALEEFSRCHLLIVDNNSDSGSVNRIRQAASGLSQIELLVSSENRGYFGGARWALEHYLAQHELPDWVIVCNNDVIWHDPSFFTRLFARDPRADGVLAPAVMSRLTGFDANPMISKRPSPTRMLRYRLLLSHYYVAWVTQWLSPHLRRVKKLLQTPTSVSDHRRRAIYAAHGSILVFGRLFFEAGGFLDDGAFLFAEEIRVAEICRRLGLPVTHDPDLRVRHEEGQTLGRMLTRDTYRHQRDGLLYALAKYRNSYHELGLTLSMLKKSSTAQATSARQITAAGDRVP